MNPIETKQLEKIIVFHYTNPEAYKSMLDGCTYGKRGLIPINRFAHLGIGGLPDKAYDGVVEGLLEPEPKSWLANPEFPYLWNALMHDICKRDKVMLLSFQILPEYEAYIVERTHIERELYREAKGQEKSTRQTMNDAYRRYWESRVSVFDYDGSYSLPQLTMWAPVPTEKLNVEWVKPTDEVWKRVIDNNW